MDTELPHLLEEFEALDHEIRRRRRERGMEFYVPNATQLTAHTSGCRTILYCGGNRSGKSTWGALELCFALTKHYPDYVPPARRKVGPVRAVVVATEFPIIERVIEPKIRQYLPLDAIAHVKRTPQGYMQRLTTTDGSTVDFLSNEMDDMAFESADWDVYWGDEPQKRSKYYGIQRGLIDRGGLTLLTFTPLIEPWMKAELADKADGKKIALVRASMRDNAYDVQGTRILPEAHIQEFEAMIPEEYRQTRLYGEFFHLRGLVYKEYHPQVHEWEEDAKRAVQGYVYPDPVVCVLDPHDRQPHHVIWAFVTRHDQVFVDRELTFRGTLQALTQRIRQLEAVAGYRTVKRLIDPNFGQSPYQAGAGVSVIQELARPPFGLKFAQANDDKEAGHLRVKDLLHYDPQRPLSFTNAPKLFFHRVRCPETINSLRNYQYDEWQGKTKDDKDPKETPKQRETHGADCVRYLAMSYPAFDRLVRQEREVPAEALYT